MAAMDLASAVRYKATELGLDLVGITDASPVSPNHVRPLKAWLDAGLAGPMAFMRRHLDKRIDPGQLLPGARCVIVVGCSYKPPILPPRPRRPAGRVAHYAQFEDYHGFIKSRLYELAAILRSRSDGGADSRSVWTQPPCSKGPWPAVLGSASSPGITCSRTPGWGLRSSWGVDHHDLSATGHTQSGTMRRLQPLRPGLSHGGLEGRRRDGCTAMHQHPDD